MGTHLLRATGQEIVEGGDLFGEGHVDGLRALRSLETPIDPNAPRLGPQVNQGGPHDQRVNDGRDSIARRFIQQAYGSINFVRHGSYCGGAWRPARAVFGDLKKMPHGRPDLENVEFAIFIGTAPGNAGNPFKRTGALLAKERALGKLEYVVVGPAAFQRRQPCVA